MWLLAVKWVVKEGEWRGIGTDLLCWLALLHSPDFR